MCKLEDSCRQKRVFLLRTSSQLEPWQWCCHNTEVLPGWGKAWCLLGTLLTHKFGQHLSEHCSLPVPLCTVFPFSDYFLGIFDSASRLNANEESKGGGRNSVTPLPAKERPSLPGLSGITLLQWLQTSPKQSSQLLGTLQKICFTSQSVET